MPDSLCPWLCCFMHGESSPREFPTKRLQPFLCRAATLGLSNTH